LRPWWSAFTARANWALAAGFPLWPLRSDGSGRSGRTSLPALADGALRTDGSLRPLCTLRAGRTNRTRRASFTGRTRRTLRSRRRSAGRQRDHRHGSSNSHGLSHEHFSTSWMKARTVHSHIQFGQAEVSAAVMMIGLHERPLAEYQNSTTKLRSASNFDPLERRARAVALAPSELVGVAETARARVGV